MATAAETLRAYGIVTPEVTAEEIREAKAFRGELEESAWDNPLLIRFSPVFSRIAEGIEVPGDDDPLREKKIEVTARMGFLFGIASWTEDEGDFVDYALRNSFRLVENYAGVAV